MDRARFLIADCPRCHSLLIADSRYKTKTCPKCNAKIETDTLIVLETAKDSREARVLVSKAKEGRSG